MIAPWLEDAWQQWAARRASGRVPHALLIGGSAGLGKRAFAEALARSLLCLAPGAGMRACGRCRGCTLLAAGTHPDRTHVTFGVRDDGAPRTEITVEQIRQLCARLALTTQLGGYQVATIDPAEAMNASATNALLKTLEEPAQATIMVLIADHPGRLAATIRSRCQRIEARYPARELAARWLREQGVAADLAERALALAGGNPGQALEFASPASATLIADTVRELERLREGRVTPVAVAAAWARESAPARSVLLGHLLGALSWARHGVASGAELGALPRLTQSVDFHKLARCWRQANVVREQLKAPLRPDLLLLEWLEAWCDLAKRA
jgi:DNA polymerase-3 subunit delta'